MSAQAIHELEVKLFEAQREAVGAAALAKKYREAIDGGMHVLGRSRQASRRGPRHRRAP